MRSKCDPAGSVNVLGSLISQYNVTEQVFVMDGLVPAVVARQNANRWAIVFSVPTAGTCQISTLGNPTLNDGILLNNTNELVSFSAKDFGPLPMMQWSAFGGIGVRLTVIEVVSIR